MSIRRRVRGVLGIAAVWGTTLSVASTGTFSAALALGLLPKDILSARDIPFVALRGVIIGAVAGVLRKPV